MITINGLFQPISTATSTNTSSAAPAEETDSPVFGAQLKQVIDSLATSTPETAVQASKFEALAIPQESTSSTAPVTVTAQKTAISAAVKNFMEWQSAQPNPLGQGTIADVWAKQGITDPFNNTVLLEQAQNMLDRASLRAAMNPSYVAEWSGDWKTQMAQAKNAEAARQTLIAASDAAGNVTVGGGLVTT